MGLREFDRDAQGVLTSYFEPGSHEVRLRHAGQETRYCLAVEACDRVDVVAHGARLAPDERMREGACTAMEEPRTERGILPPTDPFREPMDDRSRDGVRRP